MKFIMYIDEPEVLTTGTVGSYIIFGEAKFLDFSSNKAANYLNRVEKAEKPTETIQEEAEEEEAEQPGEFPEDSFKTLMEYANCSRAKAVKALRKAKGDVVEAITFASSN